MKYLLSLLLSLVVLCSIAQQTISASITHDGLQRDYILYVPAVYDGTQAVPLVMNFHGYTSNANDQMFYGDFRAIADTANFLVVHPQGTRLNGVPHWNVGGFTLGSTVDDVDFVSHLIDSLAASYSIDMSRVYSTGMSNGGYMSFLLACQLGDKVAAVASVTGSMTTDTYDNCQPTHPTPAMQIHGTIDPTVPYGGNLFSKSIADVVNYWVIYNRCDPNPTTIALPNTAILDGSTVEHIIYEGGERNTTVEHLKVTGGGHTWPGSAVNLPTTNQDFDASLFIWEFLARYDLNGLTGTMSSGKELAPSFSLFPNPVTRQLVIQRSEVEPISYEIMDVQGRRLMEGICSGKQATLDLTNWESGIYLLKMGGIVKRFVVK